MCNLVSPYLSWSRKHIFSWSTPQASAITGSQIIGQGCCLASAYLTQVFSHVLWTENTFSLIQLSYKSSYCMNLLGLSSKQPCKICHRSQCTACIISWCWHFSSVKINVRNVLLKAKVIILKSQILTGR